MHPGNWASTRPVLQDACGQNRTRPQDECGGLPPSHENARQEDASKGVILSGLRDEPACPWPSLRQWCLIPGDRVLWEPFMSNRGSAGNP